MSAPGTFALLGKSAFRSGKRYQPSRRPAERHLSLLKDGRGAKEEDNMSMPDKLASGCEAFRSARDRKPNAYIIMTGHKVFVSYKYWDFGVQDIYPKTYCTPRDYVDVLESRLGKNNVYKGEQRNEDLGDKSDEYIWEHLKDLIYDSSVTIVLVSPNMRDKNKWDRSQWIPWEIRYSLCEYKRDLRYSHTNGLIYVVLPDKQGNYDYAFQHKHCCSTGCNVFLTDSIFAIMEGNLFNRKTLHQQDCLIGDRVYNAFDSYASIVKWCDFMKDDISMNVGIALAFDKAQQKEEYNIRTEINRT